MALNIELLEQSFEQVKVRESDFTALFYSYLFADYPETKPLFVHASMEEQGKKLFASLVLVINSLRQPDALNSALTGLGTRHIQYGVLPEHYPMVGNTLLKTLASFLGTAWTPQTKQAWVDAYDAIARIMLEGADYTPAALKLQSSSPGATA